MDPVTVGLIGAGVSAAGTIFGGIAQARQAEYQAEVARNNQIIAQQRADYARQAGQAQATAQGIKERSRQGALRAALAASGLDVNTGSAGDLQEGEAGTGALNQMTAEHNALLSAYGYEGQATGFGAEAGLQESRASSAIPGALFSAAGSLASNKSFQSLLSDTPAAPQKYAWMTP